MISSESNDTERIGQINWNKFKAECLWLLCALQGNNRQRCKQVNSPEPCILMMLRVSESFCLTYTVVVSFFPPSLAGLCCNLFKAKTTRDKGTWEKNMLFTVLLLLGSNPEYPEFVIAAVAQVTIRHFYRVCYAVIHTEGYFFSFLNDFSSCDYSKKVINGETRVVQSRTERGTIW